MAEDRTHSNGPVVSNFREALAIQDPVERRAWLMDRMWDVYTQATERHYVNAKGAKVPNPDGNTQVKVLTLVLAASDNSPELEQRGRMAKARLVDALEALPSLADEPDATEQRKRLLVALKEAAIVAVLRQNADVNASVGVFRVAAQVLGVGEGDEEMDEAEVRQYAKKLLSGKK